MKNHNFQNSRNFNLLSVKRSNSQDNMTKMISNELVVESPKKRSNSYCQNLFSTQDDQNLDLFANSLKSNEKADCPINSFAWKNKAEG